MSRPRLTTLLLLFVVALAEMVDPGLAVAEISRRGHHPPLLHCGPAPVLSKTDEATFRANLAAALAALPSAAAAKRDAFAAVHVGSAFARGACFGANVTSSPATVRACEACLSAAARDVTGGCGASSGRAGVWRNECFLSYADSNVSSPREDAFRNWFYAAPRTNATLADDGWCVTERAVDCVQCLRDSARAAAAIGWWQRIHGEEVIVVGYSCFLRVRISTLPDGADNSDVGSFVLSLWLHLMFEVGAVIVALAFIDIIKAVRALPQVNG
ncbi:hypothetical protein QOZ80_2BG0165250 [Eleusine coracana subsp. coracana]|nr:hypothetical protein QOZ80_2BG0165250 [Eleusine coracana subsp. coracana]